MTPLILPDAPSGIQRVQFEIERVDYAAPEASGRVGGVQAGWPLWMARYELDRCDSESSDLWSVFFDRLRGRQRLFLAGDPTRDFPRAYPGGFAGMVRAGGGAFTGAALAWSQAFDADGNALMGLTGLPAGLVLSPRDAIGLRWNASGAAAGSFGRRTMARVVAPAVASAGGAISVMVEPPIDTRVVPVGAIAHLESPRCVMRIVPDKSSLGPIGGGGSMGGGSIVALQDLRP